MTSKSIKRNIVFTALILVGVILTITATAANWLIVGWLEDGFDDNLLTKAQVLLTLVEEDEEGIEFEFADEFMPEFERNENPEYFQFRYANGRVFESSNSLNGEDMPFSDISSQAPLYSDIRLADGQKGRLLQLGFIPQLDEELRSEIRTTSDESMILLLARERESLNFLISLVNFALMFSIPVVLLFIYIAIRIAADRGLRPLEELKTQLEKLDVNGNVEAIKINTSVLDMENVVLVINQALEKISDNFKREQRFTSDAAHELRTPIAELMNMAEVAIRWPKKVDQEEFYNDVLKSSEKMHLIVNSLFELARCKKAPVNLELSRITVAERFAENWKKYLQQADEKEVRFELIGDAQLQVLTSPIEFDLIISNLLSNAVEYSVENSIISVCLFEKDDGVSFTISNMTDKLAVQDLPHLFESLWRKEDSRNSERHIGMGLTIVKAYIALLQLTINVSLLDQLFSVNVSGLTTASRQARRVGKNREGSL